MNKKCGKANIMAKPLVISHRGASGYRPENTLEAFELGVAQGADGIEFDVVLTKDQHVIIRHENALSETTNISKIPELQSLRRVGAVDGEVRTDWFSEDLTLEQIKKLRAIERVPDTRPGSSKFDEQFEISTLGELLDQKFIDEKIVVCELKSGSHLEVLNDEFGEIAATVIAESGALARGVDLIIESFDYELLLGSKQAMEKRRLKAKYFLALDQVKVETVEFDSLSWQLDGLAISLAMLKTQPDWVETAHAAGLVIWAYTARAEEATTSIEAYYEEIIKSGVDGIFADQPDLLRRVIADRSGSAYDY